MLKVPLDNIKEYFTNKDYVLIIGLGFDSRCLTSLEYFPIERTVKIIGISNARWIACREEKTHEFNKLTGSKGKIIGENCLSVMQIADDLLNLATDINGNVVIDISAFSHELLAVILGIFANFGMMDSVTLLYIGASKYSFNTPEDSVWLSRGVRSIRSVLGFPGTMLPSKKLHLVILAGFEVERASEVILRYEPASLSIGCGNKTQSVCEDHHNKNKQFFDGLTEFVKEQNSDYDEIHHFTFSCVDPFDTKRQIFDHLKGLNVLGEKNIVICPLNTKLSTVGVVLAAIENPDIQICYAEPDEYNSDGYCMPGTEATIFSLENS